MDGLETDCDHSEKVRAPFALDCCDRQAMGYVAMVAVIDTADIRDLVMLSAEHQFG